MLGRMPRRFSLPRAPTFLFAVCPGVGRGLEFTHSYSHLDLGLRRGTLAFMRWQAMRALLHSLQLVSPRLQNARNHAPEQS